MIGAAHAVEIPFVFDSIDRPPADIVASKKQGEKAKPLIEEMMGYWTNFAKTGDPNGDSLLTWPKYNSADKQRMYLNMSLKLQATDNVEKCEFWSQHDLMKP